MSLLEAFVLAAEISQSFGYGVFHPSQITAERFSSSV